MIKMFGLCNKIQKRFNTCFDNAKKRYFETPYGGIVPQQIATYNFSYATSIAYNNVFFSSVNVTSPLVPRFLEPT